MEFHLLVSNLFIQEGVRSILTSRFPSANIKLLKGFDAFTADAIREHAILITSDHSIFYNYQPKIRNLILKKQIKTVLLANTTQMEQLKEKDLDSIHALLYTNCSLDDLYEALGFIQSGLTYRCKKLTSSASPRETFEKLLNAQQISSREMEIIKLVIEGLTSHEIAEKLHISYYTVTTHRRNVNKKLNLKNPQDLLRLSFENP